MFLIGIFGLILVFFYILGWIWRVAIPWLIVAVIVTTFLGLIIHHWIIAIILLLAGCAAFATWDDKRTK